MRARVRRPRDAPREVLPGVCLVEGVAEVVEVVAVGRVVGRADAHAVDDGRAIFEPHVDRLAPRLVATKGRVTADKGGQCSSIPHDRDHVAQHAGLFVCAVLQHWTGKRAGGARRQNAERTRSGMAAL